MSQEYTPEQVGNDLRKLIAFINGICTNAEAGQKCLGFIGMYGEFLAATLRQAARVDEGGVRSLLRECAQFIRNAIEADPDSYGPDRELLSALEAALSAQPAERQVEAVVENDPHRFAVVSTDYCRPFLLGAYPTLANATHAQNGEPEKWAIFERYPAAPVGVPDVFREVLDELEKALRKFPTWPTDPLHAVGVFNEEAGELSKAVLQQVYEPHKNSPDEVRKEARQAAAMALRFLVSLDTYDWAPGAQHDQPALAAAPSAPQGVEE